MRRLRLDNLFPSRPPGVRTRNKQRPTSCSGPATKFSLPTRAAARCFHHVCSA